MSYASGLAGFFGAITGIAAMGTGNAVYYALNIEVGNLGGVLTAVIFGAAVATFFGFLTFVMAVYDD